MLGKEKHYKEIAAHIKDWFQMGITLPDLKKVMGVLEKEDPDFWKDEYKNESYTDTMPRESIADGIGRVFVGKSWPIGMDSKKYSDAFFKKLGEVAKKRKWK